MDNRIVGRHPRLTNRGVARKSGALFFSASRTRADRIATAAHASRVALAIRATGASRHRDRRPGASKARRANRLAARPAKRSPMRQNPPVARFSAALVSEAARPLKTRSWAVYGRFARPAPGGLCKRSAKRAYFAIRDRGARRERRTPIASARARSREHVARALP
jgi:hypothetical protein